MDSKGCSPLLELRKDDFLSVTTTKAGLACVRSFSGTVLFSCIIRSPKSLFLQQLMLPSADTSWFQSASLF